MQGKYNIEKISFEVAQNGDNLRLVHKRFEFATKQSFRFERKCTMTAEFSPAKYFDCHQLDRITFSTKARSLRICNSLKNSSKMLGRYIRSNDLKS